MAQNPDQQARKLLQELEASYKRLGETNPFANFNVSSFNDANDAVKILNQGLKGVQQELSMLDDDLTSISAGFKNIVSSIRNTNTGLNLASKSFNTLSSLAQKLKNDQSGISQLSKKELVNLKDKIIQERQNLVTAREILNTKIASGEATQKDIDALGEINALLQGQDGLYRSLLANAKARLKEETNIENALGLGGAAVTGIEKTLQKMGMGGLANALGLDEVRKKMREVSEEVTDGGKKAATFSDKFKVLKSGIGEAGKQLISNLKDPLVIIGFLADRITKLFLDFDKSTGETAKNMGISYTQSVGLAKEFNSIAMTTNSTFVTTKSLSESYNQINQALGTNGKLSEDILVSQTKLVKQAGYSVEAATMLSKLSLATKKPTEDIAASFLGSAKALNIVNGTAINEKQLLEDISGLSKDTLATFANQPGKLAEAAYEARKLGLSLEKLKGTQSALLDIESSIAAEFEAEVLTGKQLNLEKARYFALTNDYAGLARELKAQDITRDSFSKMNVLQQEATAKAMGMTAETMGGMLMDQEAMSKLSGIDGDNAKEKFDNLVKQVGMEEAKKRLGDDTLASQMASTSIQERFTALTEKLQEAFVGIIGPVMEIVSPLMDLVSTVLPAINFLLAPLIEGFSIIGGAVTSFVNGLKEGNPLALTLAGILATISAKSIIAAISSIFSSLAQIPFGIGLPLAGIAVAGMVSLIGKSKSMKDGVIDPKKGPVVSGDFGTVQLNPKDSIVAGTNLMPDNKVRTSPSSPPQQSQSIDYDKMAQAMSRVKVQTNLDGVRVSSELQKAPLGIATRKI
jgi:hypothetical protein